VPYIPLEVYANNPSGTVSSGGTTAPGGGTVETWTVTAAVAFPVCTLNAQQFHAADPALPSEIFTVNVCPGATGSQTWTVTRGAESTAPVAHAAGFTVVQVVSAGALAAMQYAPWQFPVGAYGAKGDGKQLADGVMSNGSATFTSATANFTAADVGKYIIVNIGAAGAQVNPLCTTISAWTNSTTVTLAASCTVISTTAAPFIYGTDDTAAINAAATAAAAFGTANNQKAQVVFQPDNYMLGTVTQTTTPYLYNTHIPVPFAAQFAEKLVLDFIGVGDASEPDYWETTVPSLSGTCLVSASFVTTVSGTYGQQSIIGGPTGITGLGPGNWANVLINIVGITVVSPFNSGQIGYHFQYCAQANLPNASYLAFAGVNYSGQAISGCVLGAGTEIVTNGISIGLFMPQIANNDNCNVGYFTAEGASIGVQFNEHFTAQRLALIYCFTCMVYTAGTVQHGASILYASCEASNNFLYISGGGATLGSLFIGLLDCETIGSGYDIYDPNNAVVGTVNWANYSLTVPNVNGAAGMSIVNLRIPPGPWSGAPAAPATTVAQQNAAFRPAHIYLSATTGITVVTVGPASGTQTTTGLVAGNAVTTQLRVPSGHWYSVTYTGTLTTKWVLE
jgi:hypothetical protein